MHKRHIAIDFFTPEFTPKSPSKFLDVLHTMQELPIGTERSIKFSECPIFLRRLEVGPRLVIGEMQRMRVNEPAIKGTIDGHLSTVATNPGEALSGLTMFLYDIKRNVLFWERNQSGVTISGFEKYANEFSGIQSKIDFTVILGEEGIKALMGFESFRKLEIRVSAVNAKLVSALSPTTQAFIDASDAFAPRTIDLTIGMGHYAGSLNKRKVRDLIREAWNVFKANDKSIEKLRISGEKEGQDGMQPLDLLENRLSSLKTVQVSDDPEVWFETRRSMLAEVQLENAETLDRICADAT